MMITTTSKYRESELLVPISEFNQEKINGGQDPVAIPIATTAGREGARMFRKYAKSVTNNQSAVTASSTLGGIGTGMLIGVAVAGPLGGAIGGLVGGLSGYFSS